MSWTDDAIVELRRGLDQIAAMSADEDSIRLTTHCMYPSNGLVNVYIHLGKTSGVVSDNGGAVSEALSAGVSQQQTDKALSRLVASQGLRVKGGIISSGSVPLDQIPLVVLLVANASKDVANWLYDHAKLKRTRDFSIALAVLLQSMFQERLAHKAAVPGKRKQHTFANVITLPESNILIVDPVKNEASSINSRVVANLDVKQSDNPKIIQRIVYDDEDEWSPDNLGLLGITGAPVVPFSKSPQVIQRIAGFSRGIQVDMDLHGR